MLLERGLEPGLKEVSDLVSAHRQRGEQREDDGAEEEAHACELKG